jgi:hypothetical protein
LWVGTTYVLPYVSNRLDHWQYGTARIAHYDLAVGHDGISHFVTEFYHGNAVIIEFAGGSLAHAYVYSLVVTGPSDTTPRVVTLSVAYDMPHVTPGKPDLQVSITGIALSRVLYNTGNAFSLSPPTA